MGMHSPLQILTKYWGFNSFRSSQQEIINEVLAGRDTLALLPTAGGKSICYQVPGMMQDGICLVVSPLISLMKDQVSSLQAKEIKAKFSNRENYVFNLGSGITPDIKPEKVDLFLAELSSFGS